MSESAAGAEESEIAEPITIGLSQEAMSMLNEIAGEDKPFREALDAYRFAIAVALAHQVDPEEVDMVKRQTKYNVGSLDRDKQIYEAIQTLSTCSSMSPYRQAERFAEWGVRDLHSRLDSGKTIRELRDELNSLQEQ